MVARTVLASLTSAKRYSTAETFFESAMRPVSAPIDLDDRSKPQARPRESRFFIQAPSADGAGCASLSTKVLGAKQRANVDIRIGEHRIRALFQPLDGVLDRLHLPQPVAGD